MIDQNALEAEQRVISLCCEDLSLVDLVTATEHDFADIRWKAVMRTLVDLRKDNPDNPNSDILWVHNAVYDKHPRLQPSDLVNIDAQPTMIERYSEIVRTNGARRRLKASLSAIQHEIDSGTDIEECLNLLGKATAESTLGQADASLPLDAIIKERFKELAEIADRKAKGADASTGIPTGIPGLDEVIGGLQRSIVTLLAARPAEGKSLVALNIVANANKAGAGVHIFSLEDPREKYADRVLSLSSRVSTSKIGACDLTVGDLGQLRNGAEKACARRGWLVDDRSGISAQEIVRSVRRNLGRNQTQLVVVDYINLIKREVGQSKREAIDDAVNVFGDAAKQDRIAYLVLAQLNRGVEQREGGGRPKMSDLKECGTLEERAKAILMLHNPDGSTGGSRQIEIIVRKNSNGETGIVKAWMEAAQMQIKGRR